MIGRLIRYSLAVVIVVTGIRLIPWDDPGKIFDWSNAVSSQAQRVATDLTSRVTSALPKPKPITVDRITGSPKPSPSPSK